MELIDKTAVENILRELWVEDRDGNIEYRICYNKALQKVHFKLNTLETKKVDLDEKFNKYWDNLYLIDLKNEPYAELFKCAKYFFELGLKTQKGEFKQHCETNCPNFDEAQGTSFVKKGD